MAKHHSKRVGPPRKRPRLKYFFINGKLHKKMYIDRYKNVLMAWNYADGRLAKYNYSDTLELHEKSFTTSQVCKMLNRGRTSIELAIVNGHIEMPQFTYSIDENRNKFGYRWSEKDIMSVLEYLASIHQGRPRRDGRVVPDTNLPTPRELRAIIHDEEILYVKKGDTFVPTFRAKEW